jgi:hypothetical protein
MRLAIEALIILGAAIQAVLGAYLVITHGLAALAPAWPAPLTVSAHLLLWPIAALSRQSPGQAGSATILLAMLLYLALTVTGVGIVNLVIRQPVTRRSQFDV